MADGPLPPNAVIGIVGGGQLGRMLASAAAKLGYRIIVLEPQEDCPAAQIANRQIVAAYDDEAALAQLAESCDVVTYEFENVPLSAARLLESRLPLHPSAQALEVTQDRLTEKEFLNKAGIPTAAYRPIETLADLKASLAELGGGVLKTRRLGYDGKGQHVFGPDASAAEIEERFNTLSGDHGLILEQLVPFNFEFSVIAARGVSGDIRFFEPARNVHENGILRRSTVPGDILVNACETAFEGVRRLLDQLAYVGVLAVEFFASGDEVIANEMAPRVHNSGHWTVEACTISQFEQHIRAIAGLPLADVQRHSDCVMENLLGNEASVDALERPDAHVTLYGKQEARAGRKMGHLVKLSAH